MATSASMSAGTARRMLYPVRRSRATATPCAQGLTLVHFSAQHKRFLRDSGYIEGLSREWLGCVMGYPGVV